MSPCITCLVDKMGFLSSSNCCRRAKEGSEIFNLPQIEVRLDFSFTVCSFLNSIFVIKALWIKVYIYSEYLKFFMLFNFLSSYLFLHFEEAEIKLH